MSVDLRRVLQAMFDVPAYRGSSSPGAMARGKWWTDSAEEASQHLYTGDVADGTVGGHVIPGQLNTEGFLEIDGAGRNWTDIPLPQHDTNFTAAMRVWLKNKLGKTPTNSYAPESLTADMLAEIADQANFPGLIIRNVRDESGQPHTQYYVADPRRRRSRFAKFEDKDSEDIMASLLLTLMGGTAATTAAFNQDPNSDA